MNPVIGRFATIDGFEGDLFDPKSLHKYSFAENNPINRFDPSGKFSLPELMLSVSISALEWAPRVTGFAATLGVVVGTTYLVTSAAIGIDEVIFKGAAPDALYTLRDYTGDVFLISAIAYETASGIALVPPKFSTETTPQSPQVTAYIYDDLYPQSAEHVLQAQENGKPLVLTIERSTTAENRAQALAGKLPVQGLDRDEYPPAMFQQGGKGASVKYISPSDNRGAGASLGNQLRGYPDGTKVTIVVKHSTQ